MLFFCKNAFIPGKLENEVFAVAFLVTIQIYSIRQKMMMMMCGGKKFSTYLDVVVNGVFGLGPVELVDGEDGLLVALRLVRAVRCQEQVSAGHRLLVLEGRGKWG